MKAYRLCGQECHWNETELGNAQPPKQQSNPTQIVFSIKCVMSQTAGLYSVVLSLTSEQGRGKTLTSCSCKAQL